MEQYNYAMSILKSNNGNPDACNRYTFAYENPVAGEGHFIHTYMHDGNPLPIRPGNLQIAGELSGKYSVKTAGIHLQRLLSVMFWRAAASWQLMLVQDVPGHVLAGGNPGAVSFHIGNKVSHHGDAAGPANHLGMEFLRQRSCRPPPPDRQIRPSSFQALPGLCTWPGRQDR